MSNALAPDQVGVKTVATTDLVPNPHNPRLLFDREPLNTLKASIDKVGILVPLTVYWDGKKNRYVILDGQRRWTCAREIGMSDVPVNVVREPTLVQNIVTMFQIHKLREDWELMPTALKLELLMNELNEKSEKKLSLLTGLDQAVVSRCKKLLSYPKKYQDMMLDPDPKKRVKADFFIELYAVRNDRMVNTFEWFKKDAFTKKMLDKYQDDNSGLRSVTDFRAVKQHINNARKADKVTQISKRLREFTDEVSLAPDHLVIRSANVSAKANKFVRDIDKLTDEIHEIDVDEYFGEEEMWTRMENLLAVITMKLKSAGRRLKG